MPPAKSAWTRLRENLRENDPFRGSPFRQASYPVIAVLIAIVHLGLLPAGDLMIARGPQALPAFPGFGLDLVVLLVFGPRYWPVLLATYFASSLWRQVPWLPSCGVAVAALTRTLIGVALIRWVSGKKKLLGPFEDLVAIALAGVVATAVGAAAGVSFLAAGGVAVFGWARAFRQWWIADALGAFITGPALLALARSWTAYRPKYKPKFALQLFLYFVSVSMACHLVFFRSDTRYLLFSVFLLILIAAAWLGEAAARFTALIISFAAVWATRLGIGVFAGASLSENLQNLVLFLVAVCITGMAVGAFRAVGNLAAPAGVLLAGWACSGWLFASMDRSRASYDQSRLDDFIASVETRIHDRYLAYEHLSWDAAGWLGASVRRSPQNWDTYVTGLHLQDRDPRIAAMSIIKPGDILEPLGRSAAERARDSQAAILTGTVKRGTASARRIQLFVPVYRAGAPLTTIVERRRALLEWVDLEFEADSLFHSALGNLQNVVGLSVSDGENVPPGDVPERVSYMTLGGKTWTFRWSLLPGFPYLSRGPLALAAGCTALLSLLLAGLVLTLQTTRRRASERWKLLQSASALGTWELDLNSEMVHCSQELLRFYGVNNSRDRFPLREWLAHVHPDDRESVLTKMRNWPGNSQSIDWQYRVVWPDRSNHWLHSKALLVTDDQTRPNRIVGVDFDISEVKQLESQLAQAQKLQSLGQLAAGVAHEINTPIQYIGDNGKFLEDAFRELIQFSEPQHGGNDSSHEHQPVDMEGNLDYLRKEVPKAASQLLEGVDQVARIVRALGEFSHPGPVEKSATDINRAIQNTIVISKNEWKHVAELTTDLDPDLPHVPCVAGEFNQVILNLIVNAAHAIAEVVGDSGRKGSIHISTRQVESMLEIRVADTGGGIPESIQSKIFDPFFTTKPVGKGTGQGLAIAHTVIVQKHDGRLTVQSHSGRGTTFLVQLPLACEFKTDES